MKKCKICLVRKPLKSYALNPAYLDNRHSVCKECATLSTQDKYNNRNQLTELMKRWHR